MFTNKSIEIQQINLCTNSCKYMYREVNLYTYYVWFPLECCTDRTAAGGTKYSQGT